MKNIFQVLVVFAALQSFTLSQSGWQIIPSGTSVSLHSIHFSDYNNGYAVGDGGTILKSTNGGTTWQIQSIPGLTPLYDVFVLNQNNVVVVGSGGTIFKTTDGGLNWLSVQSGVTDELFSVSFSGSNGICGGGSQTILYSTNMGASWDIFQTGFFGGGFFGASMLSPQIGFVAGENSIFQPLFAKTTDSGLNWDFTAFYLNNNEGKATGVDFTDLNTGYISASVWDGTGAIAKTTNSGLDWTSTMFGNPLWSVDFPISGASQIGYAVGDVGIILKTYNAGTSWQQQNSGTSLRLNKVFFNDFDFGFAVGENGTILRTTTGGEPATFVEVENQSTHLFELFQNYPNPFNPTTKIKFTIPSVETTRRVVFTTLKVYDILGNEIATLVNEEKPAGEYEIEFSVGRDSSPDIASGIYFYELQVEKYIETKKMILLK